jgi:riboflavin kinase / FMN adenylyltransferase
MQVHFGVELLKPEWSGAVGCIGTFDGVHRGHRAVIERAVAVGRASELPSVLVTFDRHPAAVLRPDRCPPAIHSLAENLDAFESLGVAVAVILPFDRALSETSADAFFQSILLDRLRARCLVVGHDFAFGRGREGTAEWLGERIETEVVPPFQMDGRRVSSTDIRRAVAAGEVEQAAQWLGRPFAIPGVVVGGQRLGRTLGYPTINLARSFDQLTPLDGVYAGTCTTRFGRFKAAISIGMRPAVGGTHRTIEAYLIDYPGESLYGDAVRLSLTRRLREERNFADLEALKRQMRLDVEQAASEAEDS